MDLTKYDFKHKVIAFAKMDKIGDILSGLGEAGIAMSCIDSLSLDKRQELIDNLEHSANWLTRLKVAADKTIGGGPSEFIRDLKESPADEVMVCVETHDENEKEKIFQVFRECGAYKMKYFHPMYVEHGSVEPGHRQEIFPVP